MTCPSPANDSPLCFFSRIFRSFFVYTAIQTIQHHPSFASPASLLFLFSFSLSLFFSSSSPLFPVSSGPPTNCLVARSGLQLELCCKCGILSALVSHANHNDTCKPDNARYPEPSSSFVFLKFSNINTCSCYLPLLKRFHMQVSCFGPVGSIRPRVTGQINRDSNYPVNQTPSNPCSV